MEAWSAEPTRLNVSSRAATLNEPPDRQHDYSPDHRADQSPALIGPIPAQSLAQISSHEPSGFILTTLLGIVGASARHKELGNNARNEPDDERPNDAHGVLLGSWFPAWWNLRDASLARKGALIQQVLSKPLAFDRS